MKKLHKMFSALLCMVLLATFFPAPALAVTDKEDTSPRLVESVKVETYDYDTKTWRISGVTTFTYDKKGNPTRIIRDKRAYGESRAKYSYTYRSNGKRKEATYKETGRSWSGLGGDYKNYTNKGNVLYNKSGRKTKRTYKYSGKYESSGQSSGSDRITEEYKHVKAGLYVPLKSDGSYNGKYKVTSPKKGILKTVKYSYFKNSDTYELTYSFDKKGLMKRLKYYSVAYTYKYSYYKNGGLVKRVKRTCKRNDGQSVNHLVRFTFTYSDKKTTKGRYACMINSFLSLYGDFEFFWY